jgi:hypothetical protein
MVTAYVCLDRIKMTDSMEGHGIARGKTSCVKVHAANRDESAVLVGEPFRYVAVGILPLKNVKINRQGQ